MEKFTKEDLVTVYFAAYESSGDISMLIAFDEDTLNKYEYLRSCGEMGRVFHAEILKDSRLYKEAVDSDEYLNECIQEMNDEKDND